MKLLYQDLRANLFKPILHDDKNSNNNNGNNADSKPTMECHNGNIAMKDTNQFLTNATLVWRKEIFPPKADHHHPEEDDAEEERTSSASTATASSSSTTTWPSVVYLLINYSPTSPTFSFQDHVQSFVNEIPPTWNGTLFLGDYQFSAREAGFATLQTYNTYKATLKHFLRKLNDSRIRWLDGIGISKDMRMYAEFGEHKIGQSQHFHRWCDMDHGEIRVCSNITETIGQLLLGHAIGQSKSSFIEKAKTMMLKKKKKKKMQNQKHVDHHHIDLEYCHSCPKEMLPFHITPNPKLTCAKGILQLRNESQFASSAASNNNDNNKCPQTCLIQPPNGTLRTQSDVVEVRYCSV